MSNCNKYVTASSAINASTYSGVLSTSASDSARVSISADYIDDSSLKAKILIF